jgi:hypothetical protein
VHSSPPVAEFFTVALAAKPVRLLKRNGFAAGQVKDVPIRRVVAIETPAMLLVVFENDVRVHILQSATGSVRFSIGVARGTRKDAVAEWRRWYFDSLFGMARLVAAGRGSGVLTAPRSGCRHDRN